MNPLTPTHSRGLQILIAEDDPMMQLGLVEALSDYADLTIVGQVCDGLAAVDAATHLQPDLILMDIGLPLLDGIAATERIKAILPAVRIVVLTSHTAKTEVMASLSIGADAYCLKGASVERLMTAIQAAKDGGTYLDPEIAHVVVQHLRLPDARSEAIAPLSERELEVLKLIVEGYSNPEIAKQLYISLNTVKTHVRGVMNKLAVDDRVQAAVVALRSGLIS